MNWNVDVFGFRMGTWVAGKGDWAHIVADGWYILKTYSLAPRENAEDTPVFRCFWLGHVF